MFNFGLLAPEENESRVEAAGRESKRFKTLLIALRTLFRGSPYDALRDVVHHVLELLEMFFWPIHFPGQNSSDDRVAALKDLLQPSPKKNLKDTALLVWNF